MSGKKEKTAGTRRGGTRIEREDAREREREDRATSGAKERILVNPKPVINASGHRDIVDLLIGWIKDKYIWWRRSEGRDD